MISKEKCRLEKRRREMIYSVVRRSWFLVFSSSFHVRLSDKDVRRTKIKWEKKKTKEMNNETKSRFHDVSLLVSWKTIANTHKQLYITSSTFQIDTGGEILSERECVCCVLWWKDVIITAKIRSRFIEKVTGPWTRRVTTAAEVTSIRC